MFGDIKKLEEMKKKINSVSPSFCMAKWMHATIHLGHGQTHSCYLPPTHKIPVEEIQKNPAALHNTPYKKLQRKKMLEGVRPEECGICWGIEDLPGDKVSDRQYRAVDSWTMPFFDKIRNLPWDADINPTYLEVSFGTLCNFKCSYCSPAFSTRWEDEIKQMGPYELSQGKFQDIDWMIKSGAMPIPEDQPNPYLDAFWKWWPDLVKDLMFFRITGGEPLLSKNTYRVLDWIDENPQPHLELSINSNMGIPDNHLDRFVTTLKRIMEGGKLKSFILHTSCDTYGKQAEYLRCGLVFQKFESNLHRFLSEVPNASLAFMSTFNNLSIVGYRTFLEWVIALREKFNNEKRQVLLDIPHLMGPRHQSVKILTEPFAERVAKLIEFMKSRTETDTQVGIRPAEIFKMERILEWMKSPSPEDWLLGARRDFYLYFKEHDRRRSMNFQETYPEMKEFWDYCQSLVPEERR